MKRKIAICGSMSAVEKMKEVMQKLLGMGHEVKMPELRVETQDGKKSCRQRWEDEGKPFDAKHELWSQKDAAIRNHLQVIDWSDCILVVNEEKRGIPGYIGINTIIEMAYARRFFKQVYVLNPLPELEDRYEEIAGTLPFILHGRLELIQEKICNNTSVGVVVVSPEKKILCMYRIAKPEGWACPAGHVDPGETSIVGAASRELQEEVNLSLPDNRFSLLWEGSLKNQCSRMHGSHHYWWVYKVEVTRSEMKSINNNEPDKCKKLEWFTVDNLPFHQTFDPAWQMIWQEVPMCR